jgi:hypothetical protein
LRKRDQRRWRDVRNSDGTFKNKRGIQQLENHALRDVVHISVKDQEIDAKYLGVSRMRKERKQVAESERRMLEKIRFAERFQNEAVQRSRTTRNQLFDLQITIAQKDKEINEFRNAYNAQSTSWTRVMMHPPISHIIGIPMTTTTTTKLEEI